MYICSVYKKMVFIFVTEVRTDLPKEGLQKKNLLTALKGRFRNLRHMNVCSE